MEIPVGVQDVLPPLAQLQRSIENEFLQVLAGAGFSQVCTPTFEFYQLYQQTQPEEEVYKLIDPRGRVLAVRPDFTLPVMRLALSWMDRERLPWRLCYVGQVFRLRPAGSGRNHEYTQVGAEVIGAQAGAADTEVLWLASKCLESVGCPAFRLVVGDCQVTQRLLTLAGLDDSQQSLARAALLRGDLVALERCLASSDGQVAGEVFRCLTARGKCEEIARTLFQRVGDLQGLRTLDRLSGIVRGALTAGVRGQIEVDFGLVRDMSYYTGMVFEVYVDASATSIGGGGRYDKLASVFGKEIEAVGFAVNVSELARVLCRVQALSPEERGYYVACSTDEPATLGKALAVANVLRRQGHKAEVDLLGGSPEELRARASAKGYRYLLRIQNGQVEKVDLRQQAGAVPGLQAQVLSVH